MEPVVVLKDMGGEVGRQLNLEGFSLPLLDRKNLPRAPDDEILAPEKYLGSGEGGGDFKDGGHEQGRGDAA